MSLLSEGPRAPGYNPRAYKRSQQATVIEGGPDWGEGPRLTFVMARPEERKGGEGEPTLIK
jgi:hypothetical protein